MTKIKIDAVIIDAGTQTRVTINEDTVTDYAEAMTEGAKFPPVVVFSSGTAFLLADGFHRVIAAERCGWREIDADVRKGSKQDAIKYSLGANTNHGLRRTNADKRRCVEIALREFAKLSDTALAEMCGVCRDYVMNVRHETTPPLAVKPQVEKRTGKDRRTIKTADIGGPPPDPNAKIKDPNNKVIPAKLLPLWHRGQEIQEILTQISKIRCTIERAVEDKDKLYSEIIISNVKAELDNAYAGIKATKPYCVCPMCQGEGCRACNHRGLIGKFRYDISVPKELKK